MILRGPLNSLRDLWTQNPRSVSRDGCNQTRAEESLTGKNFNSGGSFIMGGLSSGGELKLNLNTKYRRN